MTQPNGSMAQLDALDLVEGVRQRLTDFAGESCYVRDSALRSACQSLWSGPATKGGLVNDLWVEAAFPAENGNRTLADFVTAHEFPKDLAAHLHRRGAFPSDRPLYSHQQASLERAFELGPNHERPAIVVTAGTGMGKTESFLLPVLKDLWTTPKRSERGGVRCLILYPMNALVNDQVDRLHDWLTGQNHLTLFHFTSETPEDSKAAQRNHTPLWRGDEMFRMRTRRQARGLEDGRGQAEPQGSLGPQPDILITNYSMLEYMLCRPQDAILLGENLQSIVLDEVHLYNGTLAAEITLLLRRLLERCGRAPRDILQIATSATLGGGSEALVQFAGEIFSKDTTLVRAVAGVSRKVGLPEVAEPERPSKPEELVNLLALPGPTLSISAQGNVQLAEDVAATQKLKVRLSHLTASEVIPQGETRPAVLLYEALGHAPLVHKAESILWGRKRLRIDELADDLFDVVNAESIQATIALLRAGAAARKRAGDLPLLPHRMHLLVRGPEGVSVCLNPTCTAPATMRLPSLGGVFSGQGSLCPDCGAASKEVLRCPVCGEWVLGEQDRKIHYVLAEGDTSSGPILTLDPVSGQRRGANSGGIRVRAVANCPRCSAQNDGGDETIESEPQTRLFLPLIASTDLALSIVAETTLAALPVLPVAERQALPAEGRRLLAFSDSRMEAARLGPRLTTQHETQLVRAILAQCLEQAPPQDADTIVAIEAAIQTMEAQIQAAINPTIARTWSQQRDLLVQQLTSMKVGGDLDGWAEAFCNNKLLGQLFDVEGGSMHQPETSAQQIFDRNRDEIRRQARLLMARQLASPSYRQFSLETLGLAEVTYPGLGEHEGLQPPLLDYLPSEVKTKITDNWHYLLATLLDTLRVDGAVTLRQKSTDTADVDDAFDYGGRKIGRWMASGSQGPRTYLLRFCGVRPTQRRRDFVARILVSAGIPVEVADLHAQTILSTLFDQLFQVAKSKDLAWLEAEHRSGHDAIRIRFYDLGLRRPSVLFRSKSTGKVFPRGVLGCAPEPGCSDLETVGEEALDQDPRIGRPRREYRSAATFTQGLWAEEHSAQLAPEENRRLQGLFKKGMRNLLSSTTTMELGIDIGGLSAVLMTNVPPGKANYLQRAGRAGRRADGSSIVITFARPRPFDHEVFRRFGDYLDRPLREPKPLSRARIVQRHLNAVLLSDLFQAVYPPGTCVGAMNAFGSMGAFCGVSLPQWWESSSHPRPSVDILQHHGVPPTSAPWWNAARQSACPEAWFLDYLHWVREMGSESLEERLRFLLADTVLAVGVNGLFEDWYGMFDDIITSFASAISDWRRDYDSHFSSWYHLDEVEKDVARRGNAHRRQMEALADQTVIEALADRQFLPRYGFPIGVQKLRVAVPDKNHPQRVKEDDQFRLSRGGLQALREYVPGSQLLVAGKLVRSRGLLKHWTGAEGLDTPFGIRGRYAHCANKHTFYTFGSSGTDSCPFCDSPAVEERSLLVPEHGFTTAAWEEPRRSLGVEPVGFVQQATVTFHDQLGIEVSENFAGISGMRALYRENGELLVYNEGENHQGFAICTVCGFSDSEVSFGGDLPSSFRDHHSLFASEKTAKSRCRASNTLRNIAFAARETTDVLMIELPHIPGGSDLAIITTLAHALRISGAESLELDTRELGCLVCEGPAGRGPGAVIYDNVPGGAAHVRALRDQGRTWLEHAQRQLRGTPEHDARCTSACLDCLLTFDAQSDQQKGLLNRRRALQVLDILLGH
ncbi:DEAD/DEAH box helicase [Armatimonas rosea]|uniref:DEAD/DEAH box helicase n=1 Tax=Armatimonas rosea TaxID=685828 RepID=A0A7W9SWB3_ARMRO|nr:DEAD/DEAH box helicase [Armatimonas rosea]MBB6053886.1 hypothetical protein [Armatimonas rosea]